jgi:hypothetical protein
VDNNVLADTGGVGGEGPASEVGLAAGEDGPAGGALGVALIRPFCITILYHNLLLFIDIFHI